jgi:hypothetical protein
MKYLRRFFEKLQNATGARAQFEFLSQRIDRLQQAVGRIELRQQQQNPSTDLHDHEFQVSSQWGEDGIIQYLIQQVEIPNPTFVEFGVQDYTESNTRFLLQHNNWSGLVIDATAEHIDYIRRDAIYWRHNLKADCAFIDRDNINGLLERNGVHGDIGLLSIDIDGNDYWVWEAISVIRPRLVVCEYNSVFGSRRAVTVPYERQFERHRAHFSGAYWGASLAALDHLARKKGYALVGINSVGINAFFVRADVVESIPVQTPRQAYVKSQFRDTRNPQGQLTFGGFEERRALIAEMPLYDVERDCLVKVKDITTD